MIDQADLELFERSLRHANESFTGAALDAALGELGWHDAFAIDPRAAIAIHFELQGRSVAVSSALDHVVALTLGADSPMPVVLPELGSWAPPGSRSGDRVVVSGFAGAGLAGSSRVLVVATLDGSSTGHVVDAANLTVTAAPGLDPALGLVRATGEVAVSGSTSGQWDRAVDLARLAVAHELVGVSRSMLAFACDHARERVQFGQPIAAFQAVRHRLADSLVAIEGAAAMLDAAWLEGTSESSAMAKAVAGRSARTVAKHAQQVLAGIGFTVEHPFHTCLRRVLVLDELFGSARTLTRSLGAAVLEQRRLPPLLSL